MTRRPAIERFWERVERTDTCWLWTGAKGARGYGNFKPIGRRTVVVHRYAYEQFVGPIPEGLTIDHLCRVRNCVNPAHLEAVTSRENILRGESVSAQAARRTHCPRGHAYDAENTYRTKLGHRSCRACHRLDQRERQARKRAERRVAMELTNSRRNPDAVVPRPAVKRRCHTCERTDGILVGPEWCGGVISVNGVMHVGTDVGFTACGKDATGDGWWWPV